MCVCEPLQDNEDKQSALHKAIANGWTSTVAELLSLGANAALRDAVSTCTCMSIAHRRGCASTSLNTAA